MFKSEYEISLLSETEQHYFFKYLEVPRDNKRLLSIISFQDL